MSAGHLSRQFRPRLRRVAVQLPDDPAHRARDGAAASWRPQRHRGLLRGRLLVAGHLQHAASPSWSGCRPSAYRRARGRRDGGDAALRRQAGDATDQESRSAGAEPRLACPPWTSASTRRFLPHDDPEASLAFYRDTLGFEVRNDVEYGGMHWITVGPPSQPGTSIVLYPPAATPGITDDERRMIAEMMAKGTYASINLATPDLDGAFERMQAGDAEVVQEPTEQPYGVRDCAVRDPSGNLVRLKSCAEPHGREDRHAHAGAARRRQPRPDPRARRAREQPQGRQRRDPEAPADGVHRRLRLGEELAGVRHDRRRVAAADQRDLQRLRAGLHADAGAARGRRARRADHGDHRRPGADGRRTRAPRSAPPPTPTRCCASCSAGSGEPHIGPPSAFSFNVAVGHGERRDHGRARATGPDREGDLQPHRRHVPALRGPRLGHRLRPRPRSTTTRSRSTRARSRSPATAWTAGTAGSSAAAGFFDPDKPIRQVHQAASCTTCSTRSRRRSRSTASTSPTRG